MLIKENWISFLTILRREVTRVVRIWPQTVLPPVITMSLYFVIFGNLIGPRIGEMEGYSYIQYIVPGLIMMSIITSSYANVVSSFFGAKFQKHIEELLVAPTYNSVVVWGFVCGGVTRGLAVGFFVSLIALFFTKLHFYQLGITMLVAVLTAILFSLMGLLNGIFAKKFDDISIIPTFVLTPLTYLGGVFYSIDLLPVFWQKVTYANPVFYMVNAFRYGMLGESDVEIEIAIIMISGFIIALYAISLWLIKKGYRLRS